MEFYRLGGMLDLDLVRDMRIAVVGLGSLGSKTVGELAYPWKELILIDPDRLEIENVERHLLGKPQIGRYKVDGVKQFLVDYRGLNAQSITVHHQPAEAVLGQYPHLDLIINASARPSTTKAINYWCHLHRIPQVIGGVFPNGKGGSLYIFPDPSKVCRMCFDADFGIAPVAPENYGYRPTHTDPITGEVKEAPALSCHISSIAADMAMVSKELLMSEYFWGAAWLIHAHGGKDLLQVDDDGAVVIREIHELTEALGMTPTTSLDGPKGGLFTLWASHDKIRFNIRESLGCPLHFQAAIAAGR